MVKALLILVLLIFINVEAASFNCNKVTTEVEKLICSNEKLSSLDSWLGNVYQGFYRYTKGDERRDFKQKQLSWIKERDNVCKDNVNKDECLINEYKKRIDVLNHENEFLSNDIEKKEFKLLEYLISSKKFVIHSNPKYYKINDIEFLIAIDWGQGGRVQHGIYYVNLKNKTIERIVPGYPSLDGIYKDRNRTVLILDTHSENRGLGWRAISTVEVLNGKITTKEIASIEYYATDGEYEDKCYDPSNNNIRINKVGKIKNIDIKDIDLDGYRDLSVEATFITCKTKKTSKKTYTFLSKVKK